MKTKVSKLYDMNKVAVPQELCKWRVSSEEVDAQLARIATSHPLETKPEKAEMGDSVLCRTASQNPRWNRVTLPLYPGRNMAPAFLENAVVGMQLGETKSTDGIQITVLDITRRRPAALTDALMVAEKIDGVETITQYRDWWKAKTEVDRKATALNRIVYCIQQEMVSRSEFDIDEEELSGIAHDMAKKQYTAMVNAGIDPTVPEDGVDFLTEEEALKKIAGENSQRLLGCVLNEYYATVLFPMTKEEYSTAMTAFEHSMGKTHEELIAYAGEFLVNDYIYNQVFAKAASQYANTLLED